MYTLEELDAMEHYKIIGDETELKWFYNHCVYPLKRNEAYAFCLSSRFKKLTEEERGSLHRGRTEMCEPTVIFADSQGNTTYERWKKGIRAYECHKETFTDLDGNPFKAKTLVCYMHINPCDELKVIADLKKYINIHEQELIDSAIKDIDRANCIANLLNTDLHNFLQEPNFLNYDVISKKIGSLKTRTDESGTSQSLYKMCRSLSKMKRLQFDNVGTKYWVDFDMDLKDGTDKDFMLQEWHKYCFDKFGRNNFVIIVTGGGCHTLVKKECIKFNPNEFIKGFTDMYLDYDNQQTAIEELIYNTNAMAPICGTLQYGKLVTAYNKQDFDL